MSEFSAVGHWLGVCGLLDSAARLDERRCQSDYGESKQVVSGGYSLLILRQYLH